MFLINSDSTANTADVNLLGWENDSFSVLSSVPLSSGFSSCRSIQLGNATATGRKGIFIDYALSDGSVSTDVMLCYDRTLSRAQIPEGHLNRRSNTYTPFISCRDVDGDGVLEVPAVYPAPGFEERPANEQVSFTHWYEISSSGTALQHEFTAYTSIRNDYMLITPLRWSGLVTMNISIADGTVTFYRYDNVTKTTADELLIIRAVPEAAMDKIDLTGFTPCGKNKTTGYSFFMRVSDGGVFTITDEELESFFKIIE